MSTAEATEATLFWSETGHVACQQHAPYRGSDTWVWGRWQRVSRTTARAWLAEAGSRMACEVCGKVAAL